MSERDSAPAVISAAEFHRSDGVADWRVTAMGPQAVFRAASLAAASALVAPTVTAAHACGILPDIDMRPEAVVVSVPYRGGDGIPAAAVAFAAEVSRAATALSLQSDPALVQTIGVYVAQHSAVDARPFFRAALGYRDVWDNDAEDPLRRGPQLAFNPISGDVRGRGRTHFDVYLPADQAAARVQAAIEAGGRLVDDSHAPAWWTLASPDNHGVDIASWPDANG